MPIAVPRTENPALEICEHCGGRLERTDYICPWCGRTTYRGLNEIVP